MRYRALDSDGDYSFGGNKTNFLTDEKAVAQAVKTRLKLLLYEWWENIEDGLPKWQNIIASRDVENAVKLIKERIEKTRHVRTILFFHHEFNNETRILTIQSVIDTDYGTIKLDEEVG